MRLLRTVRYLRGMQIYGRLWFRVYHPSPDTSPAPPRRRSSGSWAEPASRKSSLIRPWTFRILNEEHELAGEADWDNPEHSKLWRYNLHYFDDLNAEGASAREPWHQELLARWVEQNPPARGTGWEPYPTSLRIVNWIKWVLAGNTLPAECVHSLAVQARWLSRRLEFHLLGNHLLSNAKALVFAGLFFEGEGADRWREKGLSVLARQIPEQILGDGGHFERSPMYHAIVLEDLLDLINLYRCHGQTIPEAWWEAARRMAVWLNVMRHPDGEIPFFNDAAMGIAPSPTGLDEYAASLELNTRPNHEQRVQDLPDSGYVRVNYGLAVAFLDAAPIGPDYLPGHAHADTFSFELSLGGQRVFVNCGTSVYGLSPRRQWERSTAAHNTLMVDGKDSSEVWSGFRVGRRARVGKRKIETHGKRVRVAGLQDGYRRLRGRPLHRREWSFLDNGLLVADRVEGGGRHTVTVRLHVHPACHVEHIAGSRAAIGTQEGRRLCDVNFEGTGQLAVENNLYAPQFGCLRRIDTLRFQTQMLDPPIAVRASINWGTGISTEVP